MGLASANTTGNKFFDGSDEDSDDYDSDEEDTNLHPDDCICLVATTEEDQATLEVYVYAPKTGGLYVHHDIALPAFPLALAWGDVNPAGGAGSYAAVGTFDTGIEVWNLDVLDPLEPSYVLGGKDTSRADAAAVNALINDDKVKRSGGGGAAAGKKKNKKAAWGGDEGLLPGSHTDAVMALSWNTVHRQVLASGSADHTVKVWDVTSKVNAPTTTFTHHKGKVQSVLWHPTEGTILATGGFDRQACLLDARLGDKPSSVRTMKINADCEALAWDPFRAERLVVATEDGDISCWDVRNLAQKLWTIKGGDSGVSDVSFSGAVPGLMATVSVDKTVCIWDAHHAGGGAPVKVDQKDLGGGKLYACGFYPSSDFLLGCGGTGGQLCLWEMGGEATIANAFRGRKPGAFEALEQAEEAKRIRDEDFEKMLAADDEASRQKKEAKKNTGLKGKNKNDAGKKKKVAKKGGR